MNLSVDLTPQDINRTIVEAIAQSLIGEQLKRSIEEQVKKLSSSYDNPIDGVVKRMIADEIQRVVSSTYSEKIAAMVAEKVNEQFTAELFEKMWSSFVSRY